jgi:hypothetical protein
MAMQGQMGGGLAPGGHLPSLEEHSQVQTGFALRVARATQPFFENIEVFGNGR